MKNINSNFKSWLHDDLDIAVVEQIKTREITIDEVINIQNKAKELYNDVSVLYDETFIKELGDCRVHLSALLYSVKQLKQ